MASSLLDTLPDTGPGGIWTTKQSSPYPLGTTAQFACDPGYTPPQSSLVATVVQPPGSFALAWEPLGLYCNPISCGAPQSVPSNGSLSTYQFVFPNDLRFKCDLGYHLNVIAQTHTCMPSGNWFPPLPPNVRCDPVTCPDPVAPLNGSVRLETQAPFPLFNAVALARCDDPDAVLLDGDESRFCQQDGTWSGKTGRCVRLPCPPMDASVKAMLSKDGTMAMVDCKSSGGDTVVVKCLSIGRWSLKRPYCNKIPETIRTLNEDMIPPSAGQALPAPSAHPSVPAPIDPLAPPNAIDPFVPSVIPLVPSNSINPSVNPLVPVKPVKRPPPPPPFPAKRPIKPVIIPANPPLPAQGPTKSPLPYTPIPTPVFVMIVASVMLLVITFWYSVRREKKSMLLKQSNIHKEAEVH